MDDPMELNKLFLEHCPKAANKIEVFIESIRTQRSENGIIYDFLKSQSHIIRVSTTPTPIERGQRHNSDQTWI